jgi:hypothetical protein
MTYVERLARLLELAVARGDRAAATMLRVRIDAEYARAMPLRRAA